MVEAEHWDGPKVVYVKLQERFIEVARNANGRHVHEMDESLDDIYNILGGEKGPVAENLGEVVDSPVGCTEFSIFFWE